MRPLLRWFYVAVAVTLIDLGIRAYFVPLVVWPRYAPVDGALLRDRTSGRNLGILFDSVRWWFRTHGTTVRVIVVGDSTVHGEIPESNSVPFQLQEALRSRLRPAVVDVADFSAVGMYARETLIAVAEGLKFQPEVLVCQLTLRDVIDDEWAGKSTNIESLIGDPWLLTMLPPSMIRERYSADALLSSAIEQRWALFAYRTEVRDALRRHAGLTAPPPAEGRSAKSTMDGILSDRLYNFPNTNSKSVDLIMQVCRRSGGHCLVYIGPFNPAVSTEKIRGPVDRFRAMVHRAAADSGVPLEDYWDALSPTYFRQRNTGDPDPIHYNVAGYREFGRMLAQRVTEVVRQQRTAEEARREGRWLPHD